MRFRQRRGAGFEWLRVRAARGATLLSVARAAGLPVARACDGDGICSRCALVVLAGADRLSAESEAETRAKQRARVPESDRLSCQARVQGDVALAARYW